MTHRVKTHWKSIYNRLQTADKAATGSLPPSVMMRLVNAELKERQATPVSKQQMAQVLQQFGATASTDGRPTGVDYSKFVRFCIDAR
jgi:hypothetical protein